MSNQTLNIKDENLKMLAPTLRQKKRYVKIKITSQNNNLDFNFLSKNLTTQLIYFIGSLDFQNSGVWILKDKFDLKKQELVLRVSTKLTKKVVASLNLINKLENQNIKIEVKKVTTTLKKLS